MPHDKFGISFFQLEPIYVIGQSEPYAYKTSETVIKVEKDLRQIDIEKCGVWGKFLKQAIDSIVGGAPQFTQGSNIPQVAGSPPFDISANCLQNRTCGPSVLCRVSMLDRTDR